MTEYTPRLFTSDAEIVRIGEGLLARTLPRALLLGLLVVFAAGHYSDVRREAQREASSLVALWDTVAVYPNQTVVVRPYFDYYTGVYVFHCHAAEHGDMSMMGQMEVVA